jgi:hypothetical protein
VARNRKKEEQVQEQRLAGLTFGVPHSSREVMRDEWATRAVGVSLRKADPSRRSG